MRVPLLSPNDANAPEAIASFASLELDLMVSVSYDQIIRRKLRELTPNGFINCHAGALPRYRGRSVLTWAIINGESTFGVTVHYIDAGVDTGDVLLQQHYPIGPDQTYADVLTVAVEACADLVPKAVKLIRESAAPRRSQLEMGPGFYCSRRGPGDEIINWSWNARRVHNFVRALAFPGPIARTRVGDIDLAIARTTLIPLPSYMDIDGSVVGREPTAVWVKCSDQALRVDEIADVSSDGTVGPTRVAKLPIGTRLG
jgi:methionyl-tRNA formyltransferase